MARNKEKDRETSDEAPEIEPENSADLTPEERIESLERQCEEVNERWLLAQADYKNLKRRALADHELSLKRSMQPLLEELLLVLDFLDMALSSPAESPEAKNLVMGVQMTRTKFVQALDASDVTEISTDGAFDPALHDASEAELSDSAEPGTILRTLRRGYTWHGSVLRPAQVVVAKGDDAADAE